MSGNLGLFFDCYDDPFLNKQELDDYELRFTQEIGHNTDDEANSTILMPGQTLQRTGFKLLEWETLAKRFNWGGGGGFTVIMDHIHLYQTSASHPKTSFVIR